MKIALLITTAISGLFLFNWMSNKLVPIIKNDFKRLNLVLLILCVAPALLIYFDSLYSDADGSMIANPNPMNLTFISLVTLFIFFNAFLIIKKKFLSESKLPVGLQLTLRFLIINMMFFVAVIFNLIVIDLIEHQYRIFHQNPFSQLNAILSVFGAGFVCTLILDFPVAFTKSISKINDIEKQKRLAQMNQLKLESELQLLQRKVDAHFLFNALNSIAGLAKTDADKTEKMAVALSKLLRYSLNNEQGVYATVDEEIEMVSTYLDVEKIRFGERLLIQTQIDESAKNILIPFFILQPVVENAIKHGMYSITSTCSIVVSVFLGNSELQISVFDNGRPFPTELNFGYGLKSVYDKLDLLFKDAYRVEIINEPVKEFKITLTKIEYANAKN